MTKKSEPAAMVQHYEELKARCTKYFISVGHPKGDLDQLWRAVHQAVLTLKNIKTGKEKRVGIDKAIEVLGEDNFLSGISRCAFHATAYRESTDLKYSVDFDLRHWWKY